MSPISRTPRDGRIAAAARSTRARSAPARRRRPRRRSAPSRRSRRRAPPGTTPAPPRFTAADGSASSPGQPANAELDDVRRPRAVGRAERQHLPPRLPGRGEPVDEPVGRCTQRPTRKRRNVEQNAARTGKIHDADAVAVTPAHASRRVARRPGRGMTPEETERLVAGEHADPHSVLGAHRVDGGMAVRVFRPAATAVRVLPQRGEPVELELTHPAGVFDGRAAAQADVAPLPPRGVLPRRGARRRARRLLVRAVARRARPASRSARAATSSSGTRSARIRARSTAPRARRSRSGRPGPARSAWSATSTSGTSAHTRCGRSAPRACGSCSCPRPPRAHAYKFAIRGADGVVRLKADPVALRAELPPKTGSVVFEPHHRWARRGLAREPRGRSSRTRRRSRSTRCTSAPGGSTRWRATAR